MKKPGIAAPEALHTDDVKLKGFKVHEGSGLPNAVPAYGRRDIYKIVMVTGEMTISYGMQTIDAAGTVLFFGNPHVPYSVVHHKPHRSFACVFTEDFISSAEWKDTLQHAPFFRPDGMPVVHISQKQQAFIASLYKKMLALHNSDVAYKYQALRKCTELIMYEALGTKPLNSINKKNAATRITHLFTELLERQFPIENAREPLQMRTAHDFAAGLSVHVNYLNRSVKEVTGKPTSAHIAARIAEEAKALLKHADWSVADIAYGLGFEYPTYFNNYFKRVTGHTPNFYRNKIV